MEEADSVGGEELAIAAGLAEAQAQVLGGVVWDEGLDLEAVVDPRVERAIAPQGEAIDVVEAAPTSSGPRTCRSRRPWPCKPSAPPIGRLAQWHRGHRLGRASLAVGARSNQFLTSSAR
jgi:hypothetical protein